MNDLKRYRVTGVSKATSVDVQLELNAINEANAKVKAELQEIVVTSVEEITLQPTLSTDATSPTQEPVNSVEPEADNEPVPMAQATRMTLMPPSSDASSNKSLRRWGSSVPAAIGWVVFALALLTAIGQWLNPNHRRDSAIEAIIQTGDGSSLASSIGFLLGSNMFGVVAAMLGFAVFLVSRRTAGRMLVVLSLVTIAVNVAGQCRPSSESLSGTGFTTTTTPQAKQAAKDMSRMFDRVIPTMGEAPSVRPEAIASSAAHGELSHLVKVTQELLAGMLADAKEYQSGVLSLRLDSVLLPMRLDSATEIKDSKAKITSAQRLFNEYDAAVRARMKDARDGFASAPYTPSVREGLVRSFDQGMATTMPQLERVLSYEAEMYVELTALLDFMLTQQGRFRQVGNQLLFDDEADAATYNASLSRYQAIAVKQISLRELMQEGARANADRLRRASETGVFDDAATAPPPDIAKIVPVSLSPDGASINGKSVAFPLTVADITAVLGPPSRVVAKINTIHVWDAVGIYTYSKPGRQEVDSIVLSINKQHEYEFSPKNVFSGPIYLASIEVRDIDTPRSLNRRLKGVAFTSLDPWSPVWDIHFPTYSVGMSVDNGGLSDTIIIQGPRVDQADDGKPEF